MTGFYSTLMQVVIQNSANHEFYAGEGHWISTRRGALVFLTAKKAEVVAKEDKLESVELVVAFSAERDSFKVPLSDNPFRIVYRQSS
jgi:hypothetical protein